MSRRRRLVVAGGVAVGVAAGISAAIRHGHRPMGREVPGGILMRDARSYDPLTHGWLLRGFYERIARDIAAAALPGAHLLDVGCGPGRLAILLARSDDLHVTGVDLDPAMIERATANAALIPDAGRRPSFTVADVASVPLADESQDVVVTTLSMHHWSDPRAGLAEIARVLRPGGKALVWDLRPGMVPLHRHVPDPVLPELEEAAIHATPIPPHDVEHQDANPDRPPGFTAEGAVRQVMRQAAQQERRRGDGLEPAHTRRAAAGVGAVPLLGPSSMFTPSCGWSSRRDGDDTSSSSVTTRLRTTRSHQGGGRRLARQVTSSSPYIPAA